MREGLRSALKRIGGLWLERQESRCDWCRSILTNEDVEAYVDFCMELGKLLPGTRKRIPEPKVPCLDCAGGAFTELVDGVRFSPNIRPSTDPPDPWSRPLYRGGVDSRPALATVGVGTRS